jgi:hypothetical protein
MTGLHFANFIYFVNRLEASEFHVRCLAEKESLGPSSANVFGNVVRFFNNISSCMVTAA